LRKKVERDAKAERARILKEESSRIQRDAERELQERRGARERRRLTEARIEYEERWKVLQEWAPGADVDNRGTDGSLPKVASLQFSDIPWPVLQLIGDAATNATNEGDVAGSINPVTLSSFLLDKDPAQPTTSDTNPSSYPGSASVVDAKEILRAQLLRYHPDKFEARVLSRVRDAVEKERVVEVASAVVRTLNVLLKENAVPSSKRTS